jgi:hypothetical protein
LLNKEFNKKKYQLKSIKKMRGKWFLFYIIKPFTAHSKWGCFFEIVKWNMKILETKPSFFKWNSINNHWKWIFVIRWNLIILNSHSCISCSKVSFF